MFSKTVKKDKNNKLYRQCSYYYGRVLTPRSRSLICLHPVVIGNPRDFHKIKIKLSEE